MTKTNNTSVRKSKILELTIVLIAAISSIFLWDTFIIYPIKLFVVMWHEISHGLAAILTGGQIHSIEFSFELGGKCSSQGGIPFVVASSGYLGSLIIGSALFITTYHKKASIWMCTGLSVLLIIFAANFVNNFFGGLVSIFFAILLFISPRYFKTIIHSYLWRILGFISSLYIIIDIKQDIFTDIYIKNDAHIIAELSGISAVFWGSLWFIIALVVTVGLLRYSYKKT